MKIPNDNQITIFIDIDDTITHDCGKTFIDKSIEVIKTLSGKANIILWSQGGFTYVNDIINKAKLNDFICFGITKPDIVIDDISVTTKWIRRHMWPSWIDIEEFCELLTGKWEDDIDWL